MFPSKKIKITYTVKNIYKFSYINRVHHRRGGSIFQIFSEISLELLRFFFVFNILFNIFSISFQNFSDNINVLKFLITFKNGKIRENFLEI